MTSYIGAIAVTGAFTGSQGDTGTLSGTLQDTLSATLNSGLSGVATETISGTLTETVTRNGGTVTQSVPFSYTGAVQFYLGSYQDNGMETGTLPGVTFNVASSGFFSGALQISEALTAPFSGTSNGDTLTGSISGSTVLLSPPLTISGTVANTSMMDTAATTPFGNVVIADRNALQTETVTVTLSNAANGTLTNLGSGSYDAATGVYSVIGTTLDVTAALDQLVFHPTPHQAPPGTVITTDFTIAATDTAGATATDSATSVLTTETKAPMLTSDFNGDGNSDILWRNTSGETGIWLIGVGNNAGNYTVADFGVIDNNWTIQSVGDFNGDGKADILWRNTATGQVGEWLSNPGAGAYTGFTTPILGVAPASWLIEGVGDFNGGGKSDILWRNTNGDTGVWITGAGASYTPIDFGVVDNAWVIKGVGDFNGDGKADILWQNTGSGQFGEWLSNPGAGYAGFTASILGVVPTGAQILGVADFNGDGLSDILVRNGSDLMVWFTNADGSYTSHDYGSDPSLSGLTYQGLYYFNGGGRADILWRDPTTGAPVESENDYKVGDQFPSFNTRTPFFINVDPSWVVQGTPPALQGASGMSATPLAHAMAAMGASNVGGTVQAAALPVTHLTALASPGRAQA